MKKNLLFLLLMLLPLCVHGKLVSESFESNNYYPGMTAKVSTFDGSSLRLVSSKYYTKLVQVVVTVGVGDYLVSPEYSSDAYVDVNGKQRYVPITNINQYQGSVSNLSMATLEFDFEDEDNYVTVSSSLGNGVVDYYIENITVVYDDGEEASEEIYDLKVGDVTVSPENRLDILGDGGSMQYDGKGMLVLNNVQMEASLVNIDIGESYASFTIYLKGENTLTSKTFSPIAVSNTQTRLKFTTEGNDPGSLYLVAKSQSPFAHVAIYNVKYLTYEQNLGVISGSTDGASMKIGTPIKPLVNMSATERIVGVPTDKNPSQFYNNVYDDVLYTLTALNGDGYDDEIKGIRLCSSMVEWKTADFLPSVYVCPGSSRYAAYFDGITFMVPAGTGNVIIDCMTGKEKDAELRVVIGLAEPIIFPGGITKMTRYEIPYELEHAAYVLVYNNSPIKTEVSAPDHRAGKKTTVTVGVGSVGVGSSEVTPSNPNNGDATGIETILSKEQQRGLSNVFYTVSGHRLQTVPTRKGLYILNGRKVVF